MGWADDQWAKDVREVRARNVAKYGEAVVAEWELQCSRWPCNWASYQNIKHLLFRDGSPMEEPRCPTLDEVAAEMKARKS